MSPVQGKSHPVQFKELYGNLGMVTCRLYLYLSLSTGTITCDHYARECEFGILKKKTKQDKKREKSFGCVLTKLLSSLGIDHGGRKTIPLWNSSVKD